MFEQASSPSSRVAPHLGPQPLLRAPEMLFHSALRTAPVAALPVSVLTLLRAGHEQVTAHCPASALEVASPAAFDGAFRGASVAV
eukprot:CAMPEP_0202855932 /NCGR_PEP_ID=MMETSP1389-20130828/91772_1 /ASSEMBLY_ACC=CAM_ASM_000865 /TAXON_ID=302021 /ORGANISM="Rhodomonas sp., Strain CCMP768" /LENGTH=84 /DNA_ID=CAMNT_0049534565 /DNA_START=1182 /DNA_END=1434 /DNA_ORIENTATION=-